MNTDKFDYRIYRLSERFYADYPSWKYHKIAREANAYLEGYIRHRKGLQVLPAATFKRKYQYSALKYFHKELSLAPLSRPPSFDK